MVQKRNGKVINIPGATNEVSTSTTYYHGGNVATYEDGKVKSIINGNTGIMYIFMKENQYTEMNLKKMTERMLKKLEGKKAGPEEYAAALNSKMGVKYKNLNSSKTIKGHQCNLYETVFDMNYSSKVKKQKWNTNHKSTTTHCYMNNPPKAFKEYIEKMSKGYGSLPKDIASKIKTDGNPHFGLDIHSESAMNMSFTPPPGTNAQMAEMMKKMIPVTITIDTLKELHTKSFDKKMVQLPEGAKKIVRKKRK